MPQKPLTTEEILQRVVAELNDLMTDHVRLKQRVETLESLKETKSKLEFSLRECVPLIKYLLDKHHPLTDAAVSKSAEGLIGILTRAEAALRNIKPHRRIK